MERYIKLLTETNKDLAFVVRDIVKKREFDIDDLENLERRFFRISSRIPSASNNVLASDNLNDISYDPTTGYLYILGNNAGTVQWRRIQLATW